MYCCYTKLKVYLAICGVYILYVHCRLSCVPCTTPLLLGHGHCNWLTLWCITRNDNQINPCISYSALIALLKLPSLSPFNEPYPLPPLDTRLLRLLLLWHLFLTALQQKQHHVGYLSSWLDINMINVSVTQNTQAFIRAGVMIITKINSSNGSPFVGLHTHKPKALSWFLNTNTPKKVINLVKATTKQYTRNCTNHQSQRGGVP